MPRSLNSVVEELVNKTAPSKDAPTRFDLYDLQRSIDAFTEAISRRVAKCGNLETEVARLSDQVDTLGNAVNELKHAVEVLSARL